MVKAWEAKNNERTKRAAGLGLMAVSLAACGGSDDDTPTVTLAEMLASDDLPDSYNVAIASASLGAVTVAQIENISEELQAALNVDEYSIAFAGQTITVTYSIADTAENILAFGGIGGISVVVTGDPTLSVADLEALGEIGATFSGSVTISDSAANILASTADLSDAAIVVTDTSLTPAQVAALEALAATFGTVTVQQALTTGIDAFVGTSLNDVITADFENGLNKFSASDTIDGGAGTDTLNITTIANYTNPAAATVTGVENVNINANGTVTADTTLWTGLTALNSTAVGDADLTAAITTNVVSNVSAVGTGALTVVGGDDVTVNASGLNSATAATAAITIGATTAAAGDVTVNATGTNGISTIGLTTVTAAGNVTVNQTASNAANTLLTLGNVTVNGGASTTTVSVYNEAAVAAAASVVGVSVGGAVTITDAAAAAGVADTISTVNLANFGATAIVSSALSTLNVTGGATGFASGAITLNTQSATTPATTLTINSAGGSMGAITGTQMANYTSITVDSDAATTIGGITTAAATTVLNFTGAGDTTLTTNTFDPALVVINVTGTGGVSLGTALAATTDFDGGEGADSIIISGASDFGYTMAGGNDTVTFSNGTIGAVGFTGANATGSLSGGAGTDTLVMAAVDAVTASTTGAFNADVTGFEVLRLNSALNGAVDVDGINNVNSVNLALGSAGASAITNLDSDGTIAIGAALTGILTVGIQSAVAGIADVLNLELNNTTGTTFGTVAAANVETINISAVDLNAIPGAAVLHIVSLAGSTGLTSIAVSGNNGMTVTGVATVTNFDASGVVANDASDTGANLAVSYTSSNNTAADLVSITGGDGNDTLVGGGAVNSINGGAGDDSITGGALADTIDGGAGSDTYISGGATSISVTLNGATAATVTTTGGIAASDTIRNIENVTGTTGADTITGDAEANIINGGGGLDVLAGGAGDDTIIGGAAVDTITGGAGADRLTGGGGADIFVFGNADSGLTASSSDVITDFLSGTDQLSLGVAGDITTAGAVNYTEAGAVVADFAAALAAANTALATLAANSTATELFAFQWDGANGYLFNDTDGNGVADQVFTLTGSITAAGFAHTDILA